MIKNERTWAKIDLDSIGHNTKIIKDKIGDTELMAIVKADAYGHGAVEIAKTTLYNGAESLGVAIMEEALVLRENNILEPILVLGYTPENKLFEIVRNDLIQTVFHKEMAYKLSEIGKKFNKDVQIHIKIDTGMGRLGFLPNDKSLEEIIEISKLDNIRLNGIYSHFAVSDTKEKDFTNYQYKLFTDFTKRLEDNGLFLKKHISNSGGVCQYPMYMDMVRVGILLYGYPPSNEVDIKDWNLKPAMSFETKISYIKDLDKNTSIGYGRTYYTSRKTRIATVPVGYADGYSQALSNKGKVIVNNKFAPIVGNICMDQFMIDITDIEDVKEGTKVILIGESQDLEITAEDIGRLENLISYEVLCTIGKRVPRIYMKNKKEIKTVSL